MGGRARERCEFRVGWAFKLKKVSKFAIFYAYKM